MLLGKGPVYKEKREKHDALLAELKQLKVDNKERIATTEIQITKLEGEYETQVKTSQPNINNFDG